MIRAAFGSGLTAGAAILTRPNLVPLAGVLFWGWDAFALLALFWMENVVIGVFFILRMLSLDPRDPALWLGKLFMVPFFCVHYGMFTAIHGAFVFSMFGQKHAAHELSLLGPAAISMRLISRRPGSRRLCSL